MKNTQSAHSAHYDLNRLRPGKNRSWRVGSSEYKYLQELLDGGFAEGSAKVSFVGRLESAFAEKLGAKYAISFTNGTATLQAALHAAGVGPGDEVIVPPLTMASTSLAVFHQGAVPVFADIDAHAFTIDPESTRSRITPRTKAIIPVAIYGVPPEMDAIMEIAAEHGLAVIEDAAQCFLGRYDGKTIGTVGDFGSFSFQASKHMTCGEGGMVITDDAEAATRVARFASLGYGLVGAGPGGSKIDRKQIAHPTFKRHVSLGYNFRLSELCAAFALAQLERLEEFVAWRLRCAAAFDAVAAGCEWLSPQRIPEKGESAFWAYTFRLHPELNGVTLDAFFDRFARFGGEPFYGAWALTYQEPLFQRMDPERYAGGLCPVAESVQPNLVQLKTNYADDTTIARQAEALERTIVSFD